jgi:hypothetical protein
MPYKTRNAIHKHMLFCKTFPITKCGLHSILHVKALVNQVIDRKLTWLLVYCHGKLKGCTL